MRRPPPSIDEIRVVHGIAAPGASATTLGSVVFVGRGVALTGRLRRHEYEHVRQFARHGWVGFFRRYLGAYAYWRLHGHGHRGAYRRIPFEVQAEWRARRELGIGGGAAHARVAGDPTGDPEPVTSG